MNSDRWQQISQIYHAALQYSPRDRTAFLRKACAGDDALQEDVESLLSNESKTSGFLLEPAVGIAAQMVSHPDGSNLIGRQIGVFRLQALLGAGGMAEVYRARDTQLGRDVAIKILPPAFTADRDLLTRFEREARVLAALNHPNIATIHGIEESDGVHGIVMELVEGETLAERIHRGRLSIPDTLSIARQIIDALDAAHEKGIVHRDLKPANIKITATGAVKVLDFGLAKLDPRGVSETDALSQSPTVTIGGTREGVIAGTVAYMSPEQARGTHVDKRTDIWAFGCVLYEMLTGRLAFDGKTVSDTIAAILEHEPDWNALRDGTPIALRRLLQRCLVKDPARRLRDIGDVRIELEEMLSAPQPTSTSITAPDNSRWRAVSWYLMAATAALSAVIATVAVWNLKPAPASAPQSEARLTLPMPAGVAVPLTGFGSNITVAPDGRHVAFVGRRGAAVQLYLRTLQDAETRVLPQTEGATQPFFSPDSRWLAFFAGGKLKKVPTNGGVPVVVCDAPSSRGGFWNENGTIVFSPQARGGGIFQVSAEGGAAKQITTLDAGKGETSHRLPELLPGGEIVLFVAYGATYQNVSIVAQSLRTGERRALIEGASLPHYSSTGHLLYVQPKLPGTVMAVAFDAETLKLAGTPVPVIEGVLTDRGDTAQWSLARSGMLVYAPGGFREAEYNLVLVDRKGLATSVGTPPRRPYAFPRISPDGRRIVISEQSIQNTLWIYDVKSGAFNHLTFQGNNDWAAWTPDGKRVTYASNRAEPWRLFWKPFDGSGKEEMLLARDRGDQQPYSWSSDGKALVYQDAAPATGQDIWALPIDGDRRPRPILQTPASEVDARLSPDSRWMAYASDESGRYEVYVQSFAGSGGKWQISADGGREPVWAHNGREIFFRSGEKMMVAEVSTEPTFQPASARLLFQGPFQGTTTISPNYDVMPDDQHFLMVQPSEQQSSTPDFNVVLNWDQELKRRVPLK